MRKVLFFLFILPTLVYSQNLVSNGGFEEVSNCPSTLDALHDDCANWYKSIQVPGVEMYNNPSPDWYHECGTNPIITPPSTFVGYQIPYEGSGFAGLVTFSDPTGSNYREYIGIELSEQLTINSQYMVSFRISAAFGDQNRSASNNFGVKFTTYPVWLSETSPITNWDHFHLDEVFSDTTEWIYFEFPYSPDSAYNHMHFGNFFDDNSTEIDEIDSVEFEFQMTSYFFLDDVSLTQIPLSSDDGQMEEKLKVYPIPFINQLFIENANLIKHVSIYDSIGKVVYSSEIRSDYELIRIELGYLSPGFYSLVAFHNNNSYTKSNLLKIN